jgi:hypothetical protein
MNSIISLRSLSLLVLGLAVLCTPGSMQGQQNQVMGEVQFSAATKVEKASGVWIDEQYVGYLNELKGGQEDHAPSRPA